MLHFLCGPAFHFAGRLFALFLTAGGSRCRSRLAVLPLSLHRVFRIRYAATSAS
jgi:hypothetical protein